MFHELKNLIPFAAAKYGFNRQLTAIQVCNEYRKIAAELINTDAVHETAAQSFVEGSLTIVVLNSGWAQQIQIHKHTLQKKINENLAHQLVKNIKIEIGDPNREEFTEADLPFTPDQTDI